MIAAGAGFLLLIGLWTPLAGTIVALSELLIIVSTHPDPGTCVLLATFGATLAMIGPGTWSVDARLFGRKEVRL
jgi:putative oxidoreductase